MTTLAQFNQQRILELEVEIESKILQKEQLESEVAEEEKTYYRDKQLQLF